MFNINLVYAIFNIQKRKLFSNTLEILEVFRSSLTKPLEIITTKKSFKSLNSQFFIYQLKAKRSLFNFLTQHQISLESQQ